MINLRNMSIAIRLAGGFLAMAIVVLILGVISLKEAEVIHAQTVEIEEIWVPSLRDLTALNQNFMRYRAFVLRMLLANDAQSVREFQDTMGEIVGELTDAEESLGRRIDAPDTLRIYEEYFTQRQHYMTTANQVIRAVNAGNQELALQIVDEQLNPLADTATQRLLELEGFITAAVDRAGIEGEQSYRTALLLVIIAIVVALVLTVFLAWLLTRSIVAPIRQAVHASEVIATGDLTHTIEVSGRDEVASLLRALVSMEAQLHDTIGGITNSSTQLASAAEELNAVTEDSARNIQQQNDEIQQAATAATEMTTAVEEVARNAVETSEQSQRTAASADQGREQIAQTLISMQKLSDNIYTTTDEVKALAEQAQNINSVLDVIRAVAEQTNLLALNAAIEAARAGEHGRGFAVVADEVRGLAHRTQRSTMEIEEMIGRIQEVAERTVAAMQVSDTMATTTQEQSQLAGDAFSEVSAAVNQINERNLVIASAAEEQAQVSQELDRNLINIRDLSTQSATGAEQSSAASRELSRLAIALNELITRFKV